MQAPLLFHIHYNISCTSKGMDLAAQCCFHHPDGNRRILRIPLLLIVQQSLNWTEPEKKHNTTTEKYKILKLQVVLGLWQQLWVELMLLSNVIVKSDVKRWNLATAIPAVPVLPLIKHHVDPLLLGNQQGMSKIRITWLWLSVMLELQAGYWASRLQSYGGGELSCTE